MRIHRYYVLGMAALLIGGTAMAAKPKKKDKKQKKAAVEVVDTVSVDVFSKHIGRANSNGLKDYLVQRMGIDVAYLEDFIKGFEQGALTEADKREKARLAGMEIRAQVENQVIPTVAKQVNADKDVLNHEAFVEGFKAGVMGKDVDGISMDSTEVLVQKQMEYYKKAKYAESIKKNEDFLAENAKKKDVKVTESGLQYKVLTQGTGEIPTATQKVKVNYRGTLIDGTEFDSSYKRNQPATFGCNQVIKGWTEALTMMPVGSKWELYIPQNLAYGDRDNGQIPPYSTLVFEVELLEIVK